MLQQIIDRRLSGKNKSIGNRERFLKRYRGQIREAVRRAVSGRNIRDIEQGENITVPKRDVSEPVFGHGPGGSHRPLRLPPGLHTGPSLRNSCARASTIRTAAAPASACNPWPPCD